MIYYNGRLIDEDNYISLLWMNGAIYNFSVDGDKYCSESIVKLRALARRMIERDYRRPLTYKFTMVSTSGGGKSPIYRIVKLADGSIEWHDDHLHGIHKKYQLNRNGTLGTRLDRF